MRLALSLLVVTLIAAPVIAQEQFTFFLSARTAAGDVVSDLRAEELSVTEDGRAGRVVKLTPVRRSTNVTVLLDNGFNTNSLLGNYRSGLKAFFAALPAGVEASVVTLAPAPRWVVRPTADRDQLTAGVDRLAPDTAAPRLADGLIEAAKRVEEENRKQQAYFPVIVVLSTTGPEGSVPGDRELQRMASQLNTYAARVHVIMLSTGGTARSEVLGAPQVHVAKFVADQTGGRYEAIAAPTRIETMLADYAKMIERAHAFQRGQYQVTAERPAGAAGGPGRRVIGLSRPGVTFDVTPDGRMP